MNAKNPNPLGTERCLLLDNMSRLVARGTLLNPLDADLIQVRIQDGQAEDIAALTILQVLSSGDTDQPARLGRVLHCMNGILTIEPLRELGAKVRQNLRVPVEFDSFLYPCRPRRGGRHAIRSNDLSCGGIAFYMDGKLSVGDEFEVVIPITRPAPLILNAQLLRICESNQPWQMYAAKFIHMIPDLEHKVREAVFSVQIYNNKKQEPRPCSTR